MQEGELYRNIINSKVIDFLNGYYRPINKTMDEFRSAAEKAGVPILQRDAERLLLTLAKLVKPDRIIEIGTAVGYSASCLALTLPKADIMTFEKDPGMIEKARANFTRLSVEKHIAIMEGDAEELLSKLPEKEHFQLAFIDAAKGHYRAFFDLIVPHITDGGIIICDNMLFKARVVSDEYDENHRYKTEVKKLRAFIDYLFTLPYADTSYLPVGDGTTISIIDRNIV